jgi:hypothetical protein
VEPLTFGGDPKEIICVMYLLWGKRMYQRLVVSEKGYSLIVFRFVLRSKVPRIRELGTEG